MMRICDLNELYNQCAVGLVLSLTNLSLLPLELLSSGVIPVVNRGPNNDKVVQNEFIRYAEPTPHALASAMVRGAGATRPADYARKAAASVARHDLGPARARLREHPGGGHAWLGAW